MINRFVFTGTLAIAAACAAINAKAASSLSINFDQAAIKPTPAQNAAIRRAAAADIREFDHPQRDDWRVSQADLNGDGHPDLLVQYTYDSSFCGSSGCSGVVVMATADGYAKQAISLPNFLNRMTVLPTRHLGMLDLRFDDALHTFRWDGQAYQ